MQENLLLKNLINYKWSDVHVTGNPEITHFYKTLTHLDFKRHTNFQYGMLNLEEINGSYETTLDVINYITIITDDINNIMCINFILPYTNEVVSVSINRLKIIDVTMRKTIFQIGNKYMINIKLANIFNYTDRYNILSTEFINLFPQKLKIVVLQISHINKPIEIKLFGCVLDTEERKRIAQELFVNHSKYSKIINLPIDHISNSEQTSSTYNLKNYLFAKTQTIVIKIPSVDLIDSIVFNMNNKNIKFTRSMLQMYNDTYDQIIFNVDNYHLLKLPYLISTDKPISLFTIDINTISKCNNIYMYMLTDIELTKTKFVPLIVFNDRFHTYIQYYQINLTSENSLVAEGNDYSVLLNIDQIHLKEIIISCEKNKFIDWFEFNFFDSIAHYTKTDCELYQQLHHQKINNDVYTIGFALEPDHYYSTGYVNIETLNFKCNSTKNIHKMDIYLVGHKVCGNININ